MRLAIAASLLCVLSTLVAPSSGWASGGSIPLAAPNLSHAAACRLPCDSGAGGGGVRLGRQGGEHQRGGAWMLMPPMSACFPIPRAFPWGVLRLWRQRAQQASMAAGASDGACTGVGGNDSALAKGNPCVREGTNILDGKAVAQAVRRDAAADAERVKSEFGVPPGMAVVIVGTRRDSQTYVRNKEKACEECGIRSTKHEMPDTASEEEVISLINRLNEDKEVHGILVQLPLPSHMDESRVVGAVSREKDADGFHPYNVGLLALRGLSPSVKPCTPAGVMELLRRAGVECRGKSAVVVGRSNIVGMPVALMLTQEDATVTVLHSGSREEDFVRAMQHADIVVVSAGKAGLVKGEWIKEGAVVIDVGINSVDDASKKTGYRLIGDVCFDEAQPRAGLITPVPGGVGPMTIAMLMQNAVALAREQLSKQ